VVQRGGSPLVGKLSLFLNTSDQWRLLYQDGRTFIFGWEDPLRSGPKRFADMRLDLDQQAFASGSVTAPAAGPPRLAQAHEWWETFASPEPPPSLGGDEAEFNLLLFNLLGRESVQKQQRFWQ